LSELAAPAARLVVQGSLVCAVVTGCWLLLAEPSLCALVTAVFLATLLGAKLHFDATSAVVLFLAYTSGAFALAFGAAFPYASLWLTALAGLVVGGFSWRGWESPAQWRWPLMLWLLGIALSWPLLALREADFSLAAPRAGVGLVVVATLASLASGLWLDRALGWDRARIEQRVMRPLLGGALVAAAAVFYQALVDITWLSSEPWITARRAPGLMGDANPMAVAAAVMAPLAPLVLRDRWRLGVGATLTACLWSAAWLTGARSVILLVGAGAIGLAGGALAERMTTRRAALFVGAAALVGAVGVVTLARLPIPGPVARLARTLPLDRPMDLAYEVLWRRDGYGLAAARAIREQPWSGVGNGAFYSVSTYYHRLEGGAPIPPDNAQNLWRQALAERGLLAFPAAIALTMVTLRSLWRRGQDVAPMYSWTVKAMVVGLALALTFGLPIQNPAIALTAASLLAWLHAVTRVHESSSSALRPWIVGAVWVLALAGAGVDALAAQGDLRPAWRAARLGDPYLYGFGDIEARGGVSGRVVSEYAVVSLRPTATHYTLRCWVRGSDARHVRVWQNRRLVLDELFPAGVIIERLLDAPTDAGMLLEFATDEPGIVVTGDFVDR
jgi:hypothetical protein